MATEEQVVRTAQRYAAKVLWTEEAQTVAVSLAWYLWRQAADDRLAAGAFARMAVRQVRSGRDLPGCGTRATDALHRSVQGAGMEEVRDRRPGPERLAEVKDEWRAWLARLSQREREVAELLNSGLTTGEVARMRGWTPGYISQLRTKLAEKWQQG